MLFSGAGIVNNSSNAPAFSIGNGGVVAAVPGLAFLNSASAGNAVITNTNGGVTGFLGTSTAGNAVIVNSGGTAFFSGAVFIGSSTAGNAVIANNTGGITQFNQSTTAGNATFANNGGNIASFSIASFIDALTNPSAAPMRNDAGVTAFVDASSAGTAIITNNSGGVTAFLGASTAGAATIVTNAGGATFFTGASSGGTANLVVNGGVLDLSAHALGSVAAGSLVLVAGSSYQIGVTSAGQSNALGLSGAATLQGGTVSFAPAPGNYGHNPTYTIINAAGGVIGTLAVANAFAFLEPTLSYDANNVYLTLSQSFGRGGQTANQRSVGGALDRSASFAGGDFNAVIGALAVLNQAQGPSALNAMSGQPYADFGTLNVQTGYAFLNAVSSLITAARDGTPANRAALADACERRAPRAPPVGAWMSALGGTGSVIGDGNASTLTYNLGGAAVGADYRLDPRFLVGASVGYVTGSQWVNGFDGRGRPMCSTRAFTHRSRRPDSTSMASQATPMPPTGLRAASQSRPRDADRKRTDRRQSVRRPDRDRIQGRTRRVGAGAVGHAVRAPAGLDDQPGGFRRERCERAQSACGAADYELVAHHLGRRPAGDDRAGRRRFSAGLAARVCRHRPPTDGVFRRCARFCLHGVRRHAATRQRRGRPVGRRRHRRRDPTLFSL